MNAEVTSRESPRESPREAPAAPPSGTHAAPDSETNERLVRRYFDMWNTGDGAVADAVLGPTYRDHALPDVVGPAAARSLAPRFHAAHPDAQTTIEVTRADAEFVAVKRTTRQLEQGQEVVSSGSALFRIADGKLVEQWSW
jgi:predicted SnoaL-like aldol condensation-catalyzing enzyme